MKKQIIAVIVIVVLIGAGLVLWNWSNNDEITPNGGETGMQNNNGGDSMEGGDNMTGDNNGDSEDNNNQNEPISKIGTSVEGRDIIAYHFGNREAETKLLFVGGIHGGYSWNTALVAQELVDYLENDSDALPNDIQVTVIPVLNPDGLESVTGSAMANFNAGDVSASQSVVVAGRFNANNVDLNRNFDCEWQADGTWQSRSVSGGSAAFSEPESAAVRDYIQNNRPNAVVVWYSAAGGVYASSCGEGILAETRALVNAYADGSGYPAHDNFESYEVTGDMTNWLAKINIPAISVLLTNHQNPEWNKNMAGIRAVFDYYSN